MEWNPYSVKYDDAGAYNSVHQMNKYLPKKMEKETR
jgi:hypothetical protein